MAARFDVLMFCSEARLGDGTAFTLKVEKREDAVDGVVCGDCGARRMLWCCALRARARACVCVAFAVVRKLKPSGSS